MIQPTEKKLVRLAHYNISHSIITETLHLTGWLTQTDNGNDRLLYS